MVKELGIFASFKKVLLQKNDAFSFVRLSLCGTYFITVSNGKKLKNTY